MIRFENVKKVYNDGFEALKDINFEVKKGELLVLIGPSGCGKTTTMRMINRLIEPTDGKIYINGEDIQKINPVTLRRNIGYVIQNIGLFPHMTIGENVALVPKLKKMDPEKYEKRVDELLEMVGLAPQTYKNRYPSELSGGQQQRVGVIRALAADPNIILMDEPFSALDPISRDQLQEELVNLQEEIKKTIVFVTHDMDEALKIADRICIMKDGEVVQIDTPENILRKPVNDFVRDFIGKDRLKTNNGFPAIEVIMDRAVKERADKGLVGALNTMIKNKVDTLIITEKGKYLGVAPLWNVQQNYQNPDLTLKDVMKNEYPVVKINQSVEEVLNIINEHEVSFVPVIDDENKVLGVVTRASLVKILADII
ncbi:ABC transporter ATP-binding protein [Anaerobranca gottschalkii]|uniref:Quaternary amine transport ATP-binding protein n=1 Tax=Anaerobranca gottschalkii DSM 13577 TaxID=1120990 RepID=A0A1H9YQP7_9FIRM|nr:betaine/proline/choline family ABC transporter ATP-binding protein [Anaerobranca gottschalkii]SES71435.1 osmoprotectant transport system ATP-binding protein [Anaerobranca gottschalkii DSM 13577]